MNTEHIHTRIHTYINTHTIQTRTSPGIAPFLLVFLNGLGVVLRPLQAKFTSFIFMKLGFLKPLDNGQGTLVEWLRRAQGNLQHETYLINLTKLA